MALQYAPCPPFDSPRLQSCKGILRATSLSWISVSETVTRRNIRHPNLSRSKTCFFAGSRAALTYATPSVLSAPVEVVQHLLLPDLDLATAKLAVIPVEVVQHLLLADLDPATAKLVVSITGPLLSAFSFLFIARIVMSWYPKLPVGKFPYVIAYAPTEPFLSITRKVIPPLGGVDVTPVVWFGLVSFLNEILVGPQGLLVLLSQQV